MPDLTTLPHDLDRKKRTCRAIIETPKGSRNKFAYDRETGLFELRGLLPEGMVFPFDFGFVPSTLADDGDPVDILVLMDEPAHATLLSQVEEFFISYNRQRGKVFKVTATSGPKRAVKVLEAGIRTYDRDHGSSSKDRG